MRHSLKTIVETTQKISIILASFQDTGVIICRRKALDLMKNISNMYEIYKAECTKHDQTLASEWVYRNIFDFEINLRFKSPQKDVF